MAANPFGPIIARISKQHGGEFEPCPPDRMERILALGLPPEAVTMYRDYAPKRQVNGQVVLLAASSLVGANDDLYPGKSVHPHGYVAFARTGCGDTYAFDLNNVDADGRAEVVLFPGDFYEDPISDDRAEMVSKRVAGSLMQFLEFLADGKVDESPKYL